jgi:hypothetical protein|tara:strand:- start:305 stop:490 length:186 start_codon:yes stop_codon:yes gene_type:complete
MIEYFMKPYEARVAEDKRVERIKKWQRINLSFLLGTLDMDLYKFELVSSPVVGPRISITQR